MIPPTLYRGDSIPDSVRAQADPVHRGRSFAEHYYREGLLAKSADGGLSSDLGQTLPYLVAAHIGCKPGTREERMSKHSPMISFSTRLDDALHYRNSDQTRTFEPCFIEQASHFIWQLTLPALSSTEIPGVFRLDYKASTRNVDQFRVAQVNRVNQGDQNSIISALITQIVHNNTAADKAVHTALVIEPQTFLASLSNGIVEKALVSRALRLAKEWAEWLIYPMDPMPDGIGYSARFTLNDHLSLHSFVRQAL